MVGGLYENPISRRHVHSSIPYFQDDITWCVSKAGFAPTWMNVFVIFNCKSSLRKAYYKSLNHHFFFHQLVTTWIGLVVTLFISSFFLFKFVRHEGNYHENYVWSFLIVMTISTSQYGHYWPTKVGIKLFLASIFFFGLHINTAYHSYLINVLTNPRYENQIDTVEEAIDAGLIFEVGENTVDFFRKEDTVKA